MNADKEVDNADKYLIILTDGGARMWVNDEGEALFQTYVPWDSIFWNPNQDFLERYIDPNPGNKEWRSFDDVWNAGKSPAFSKYAMTENESKQTDAIDKAAPWSTVLYDDDYYTALEVSTYYAATSIIEASQNSHVIWVDYPYHDNEYKAYTDSFKSWLADNGYITRYDGSDESNSDAIFNEVKDQLIYLLDAGSTVEDYMGYVEGDYNLDFINSADSLTLTVGDDTKTVVKLEDNSYGFGAQLNNGKYEYELTYYPADNGDEHFKWTTNVPVTKDKPVKLTYKVKLVNPKTTPGVYGEYDKYGENNDGSENYGLYTNNKATLTPVDSDGNEGEPEDFRKPTVSYKVQSWDVSKSKEATNLDKNYESRVTLSLPSAEENLVSDVVFVLDGSDSANADVVNESLSLLTELQKSASDSGAAVNVCVVKFKRQAFKSAWFDLSKDYEQIKKAMETKYSGGTNIHAGLLAGKEALEEHTNVAKERKYLILVSDGSTYLYSKDGNWESDTPFTRSYYTRDNYQNYAGSFNDQGLYNPSIVSAATGYDSRNISRPTQTAEVAAWQEYLNDVKERNETVNSEGNTGDYYDYHCNYDLNFNQGIPSEDFKSQPCEPRTANNRDMAFYYADQVWQQIKNAGYNAYSIAEEDGMAGAGNADDSHCFMNYLNEGAILNFSDIKKEIICALGAGSTVEDEIGSDFDFGGLDSVTLKVGSETLTGNIEGNTVTFRHGDNEKAYVVTYASDSDAFKWEINENVSNFARVQLTYTVKLVKPETTPGTYGKYDKYGNDNDGSASFSLYTNNWATLHPVDSNGKKGIPEDFKKPTVSYEVPPTPDKETGGLTVFKIVAGDAGDTNKEFTFTVTLSDNTINGTYGDMKFTNGAATFTLKHNEKKTATGLPADISYEVTESEANQNGYTTVASGANAVIGKNQTATVTFTNTKNNGGEPQNDRGNLIVSKIVAGNAGDTNKDFAFTVTLSDNTINGTYGGMTFANGAATFTLKHNENKTATGLPAGISYEVTESEANQNGYTTTATGAVGNIGKDQTAAAVFTNTKRSSGGGDGGSDDGYGSLTVKKTVSGTAGDTEKAFTFTIRLNSSLSGTYGDMTFEKGVATIQLKHGESSTAKDLPSGVHYSVTESGNEGYTVSAVGADGIIADGKTVVAAFTNSKDTTPGTQTTPDTPTTPDNPGTPDQPAKPSNPTPKTGDESHMDFWLGLMVISFAAFAGVCIFEKKRRYTGHDGQK